MKRIFIMSSERSGSNLLRRIIGANKEMIAPTAIHFTTNLAKWTVFYQSQKGFLSKQLVQDMMNLARSHIVPWTYPIRLDQVIETMQQDNFWGAYISLYDTLAIVAGKSGWVCKDNALFDYAAEIIGLYPDSKFIYLVRDGRDVALSFKKMPTGPKTISSAAILWTKEQQACLRTAMLHTENIKRVRYEDLLRKTVPQVKSICEFTGLQYSSRMLNFFSDPSGISEKSVFWKNLNKPLMTQNFDKWRKKMKPTYVKYYQGCLNGETKGILKVLGYDIVDGSLTTAQFNARRICDYFINGLHYFKNVMAPPEKLARRPKKRALAAIRARLVSGHMQADCDTVQ